MVLYNSRAMDLSAIILLLLDKHDKSLIEMLLLLSIVSIIGLVLKSDRPREFFDNYVVNFCKKKIKSKYIITHNEYQRPLSGYRCDKSTSSEPLPYELLAIVKEVENLKPQ